MTNSATLDSSSNTPVEDGVFSYELFGYPGENERKRNWAYIDLEDTFLHPIAYNIITTLQQNLKNLINGTQKFKLTSKGSLEPDDEGETGIEVLYKNWGNLKWKMTSDSNTRKVKINILKRNTKEYSIYQKVFSYSSLL